MEQNHKLKKRSAHSIALSLASIVSYILSAHILKGSIALVSVKEALFYMDMRICPPTALWLADL